MIRVILLILITVIVNSCSGDKQKTPEQLRPTSSDSLARPDDVGEHKSIHQEEWEYYRDDTAGVR